MNESIQMPPTWTVDLTDCKVQGSAPLFQPLQWIEDNTLLQASLLLTVFWLFLEVVFVVVLYYIILPGLHKVKPPVSYHGDIVEMLKKTLDQVHYLECYTFEMYIEGFCNAAKFENVKLDNFRSFLAWCMYHKHFDDLDNQELGQLEHIVEYAADLHPSAKLLENGFNPEITHCRMTLEPLPVIHRPLILYFMANLTEALSSVLLLQAQGFQRLEMNGMMYWYKEGTTPQNQCGSYPSSNGSEPMVFMHGISTGWMVYMPMVTAMGAGRTTILLDLEAIKVKSLNFDMPTPEQYAKKVNNILIRHKIARASIVGHSFGSITAGWLVRFHPEKISHLTLIDPVSILLGLPNVAYSFLYRQPSTLMEWLIHVTAARELTISYSLRRHFYWYNNNLWLEDVPAHIGVVVGVSSNDEIISAQAVFEYTGNCRTGRLQQLQQVHHGNLNSFSDLHQQQQQQQQHHQQKKNKKTTQKSVEQVSPASPRRVTRSMSSSALTSPNPAVRKSHSHTLTSPASYSENSSTSTSRSVSRHISNRIDSNDSSGQMIRNIAGIERVIWEGYSHGQILIPSAAQKNFVNMVHRNEIAGASC